MDFNYRPIFEPLHEFQTSIGGEYANKYLTSDDDVPELEDYLFRVFYRKIGDAWLRWLHFGIGFETSRSRKILQYIYNSPKFKFWAKNRVVKLIKANLMIEWILNQFEVQKIIYLIRNPCAVVLSQRKLGWNTNLSRYLSQSKLMEIYADQYELIQSAEEITEKLTIQWCIENSLLLNQIERNKNNILFLKYESLVMNPLETLTFIMKESSYQASAIHKITKKMAGSKLPQTKSLRKWEQELEEKEIRYILETSKKFGISLYENDY